MSHHPMAKLLIAAVILVSGGAAMADVDIAIDASAQCLDTDTMVGGKATGVLPPGKYQVSLINNTMFCDGGPPDARCGIDTVIVRGIDYAKKAGTMLWGFAVKKPATVKVLGEVPADISAFVLDNGCFNNVGTATLHFHPLN